MINKLSIRNFKSIRELDLDCRRVNVFIGEPNAGKTNILEALGLWCPGFCEYMPFVIRSKYLSELFFDQETKHEIKVSLNGQTFLLAKHQDGARGRFVNNTGVSSEVSETIRIAEDLIVEPESAPSVSGFKRPSVKYFVYHSDRSEEDSSTSGLASPYGQNLGALLASDKSYRQIASDYFSDSRYRLTVDVAKRQLSMSREEDSAVISFPYSATSETLRRMIFYRLALETSKQCILAFDEPEANSYPPYTKILAESIAKDEQENQFFLTTHSPYMLTSIIGKTPASELNVFVCRLEGSETKVYPMDEDQRMELMEMDMSAFFNLDRFLPELP